jgi:hypothetical protein
LARIAAKTACSVLLGVFVERQAEVAYEVPVGEERQFAV